MLQKRIKETGSRSAPAPEQALASGGFLSGVGRILGTIFGISHKRGQRISSGQLIARNIARSVTNTVAGSVAVPK